MKRAKKRMLPSDYRRRIEGDAYDPVLRAAKDPGQRKFDEDVKAGRASNTSGMWFSKEFMKHVTVDTKKAVF